MTDEHKLHDQSMLCESAELDEKARFLFMLGVEYHEDTERFDSRTCNGPYGRDGGKMPAYSWEAALVNKNARNVKADLVRRAMAHGCTEREVNEAIVRTALIWRRYVRFARNQYRN